MGRMHKAISISNQPNSPNTLGIKKYLQPKGFAKDDFEKKLLDFIILTDQPFTITESESFQGFALYNRPSEIKSLPCAKTIKAKLLQLYDLEKVNVAKKVERCSRKNIDYNGLLDFAHSGKLLAESLVKFFEDYQILGKISTITTDNASNNITMMKELESIMSEKGNHSDVESLDDSSSDENQFDSDVNSSGEDEASSSNTLSIYERVRKSISMIRRSSYFRQSFYEACEIKKVKHKQLVLDNQVRWNTGYFMLTRLMEMREPYKSLLRSEKQLSSFQLEEHEWDLISEMITFLKPFYEMTLHLSKAKQPSMTLSAAIYMELYKHLESYNSRSNLPKEMMVAAKAACEKLNKYYPESDGLVYILGLLLDPRCKLEWYKSVGIDTQTIRKNKRTALEFWDEFYKPSHESVNNAEDKLVDDGDILSSQMKRKRMSKPDEFRTYLSMPPVEKVVNNDILQWWKDHEQSFPVLASMARDFLAASGTGVPIERVFSFGPDLLSPKRLSMQVETVRKSFCLKAWRKTALVTYKQNKMIAVAKIMAGSRD
ncbi:unnamed protein product [Allacma fusca]|uniref:HAT C-terminal dimerisation domain-containing protein n=1 Tax=Allacma fusca TaxID=39272 RepID=A0A8J2L267_9HEXA|nr:unnamed protein product [Allacma fusca]